MEPRRRAGLAAAGCPRSRFCHVPGFAAGRRPNAGSCRLDPAPPPGLAELFIAFAKISLAGFGGVLIWARRGIVEQRRWMTADEFNETYALCHFLPGPNIVNLSVVFGSRFRGIPGGVAAFSGLVGPPMLVATMLAALMPIMARSMRCGGRLPGSPAPQSGC